MRYAPAQWRRGLWLLEAGRSPDAQAAFEKATTLDAGNPGGWIGLARVALQQQQPAQAVEVLERFLSQHPGDRYAIRLLGTAYQRLGRADDAEYALALGATGEPNWPDPWSDELAQYPRRLRAEPESGYRADPQRRIHGRDSRCSKN